MHRPNPLSRSQVCPLVLLTAVALTVSVLPGRWADGQEPAAAKGLGERLTQLGRSWLTKTKADQSEPAPAPEAESSPPSRDLFDVLGSRSADEPVARVASRQNAAPPVARQRAGSALGAATDGGGVDIAEALGGGPLRRRGTDQADAPDAAPQPQPPVEMAARPGASRLRPVDNDLALDLIRSGAASQDTSGLGAEPPRPTADKATDAPLGQTPATTSEDETPSDSEGGFTSATDAAEAAAMPVMEPPSQDQPPTDETGQSEWEDRSTDTDPDTGQGTTDRSTESTDPWSRSDSAAATEPEARDIGNSLSAERAFSNRSQREPAADRDIWSSTPDIRPGSDRTEPAGDNVLLNEQLPLITSRVTGPKQIMIGREARYQVVIENRGNAAAEELGTEVVAPDWADVTHAVASTGTVQRASEAGGNQLLQWAISRLEAGQQQTLDVVLVPKTSQPLNLAVRWRHAPVAATTMVEVQEPKLAMAISGPDEVFFGRPQTYRLTLSNPGTGKAENVNVELVPPGGGKSVSSYQVESLAPGESKEVDIEITAREPGELTIEAVAAADGSLRAEAMQDIFCRHAELKVDWRGPEQKYAGTEATYYFRVRNPGTAPAEQVAFEASLPRGFEFVNASEGHRFERADRRVVWKVGTLGPGDDCYLEVRGVLNTAGDNQLRLAAANAGGDVRDQATASTRVVALADLKLEVSDPKGPVPVGGDADYHITVTNRGRSAAEDVQIVGLFSEGIEPVEAHGAEAKIADGRVGFRPLGTLPAGQQVKLKIRARGQSAGNHLFRAEVVCRDLDIKLAAEESTRFYQDDSLEAREGIESASRASRFE